MRFIDNKTGTKGSTECKVQNAKKNEVRSAKYEVRNVQNESYIIHHTSYFRARHPSPKLATKYLLVSIYLIFTLFVVRNSYGTTLFNSLDFSTTIGKVTQDLGRKDLYNVSLHPLLNLKPFEVGVDLNFYFDKDFELRDDGNDIIVLDSVKYKKERIDIKYGDIENLTFGRGLILRNYYSNVKSPVAVNEQKGAEMHWKGDKVGADAVLTLSGVIGANVTRNFGKATLGTIFVQDSDPEIKTYGVTANYNILNDKSLVYGEAAQIDGHGTGFTAGAQMEVIKPVTFSLEYREFDTDFVPGIFDEHYEAKSKFSNLFATQTGNINGYVASLQIFPEQKFTTKISYEDYESTNPRLTAETSLQISDNSSLKIFFANENLVPSNTSFAENSVIKGSLVFKLLKFLETELTYYRAFDDADKPLESYGVKVRFH